MSGWARRAKSQSRLGRELKVCISGCRKLNLRGIEIIYINLAPSCDNVWRGPLSALPFG